MSIRRTAVSRDTFVNARPVSRNVVAVQQREIEQAPVGRMTGVEPIRGSVMGAGRPTTVAPPRNVINRQVVAQHAPVQPPTPFAQRQDKLLVRPVAPVTQPVSARPQPTPVIRPEQPINRTEPAPVERQIPQTPKPEMQTPAPRPAVQPQPQTSPVEPYHNNMQRPQPRPEPAAEPNAQPSQQQGWSHPQARPAPPVQPKTENQARDEENKYRNWQQQPRSERQPRPQPPAAKPEKPAPPKDDKKK